MGNICESLKKARKIVIKIGSNTLAKADGTINLEFMLSFAEQCASLIKQGKQIILVSSGAQVAGVSTTKEWARKKDVHYRQALCSIGQVELMHQWRKAFQKQDLHIGQLLLTKDDFENEHRSLNIRNTLFTLVDEGVVPIILLVFWGSWKISIRTGSIHYIFYKVFGNIGSCHCFCIHNSKSEDIFPASIEGEESWCNHQPCIHDGCCIIQRL